MATVTAVLNQKGGVGKTTVVLGLAAAAQRAGDQCLIIDLDPQGSASWSTGVEATDEYLSVGDVIRTGDPKVAEAATVTSGWGEGVDVLPASFNLIDREGDATDPESAMRLRRICTLKRNLCRGWKNTTPVSSASAFAARYQ